MGAITLSKLPAHLDRWGVRYDLLDGWLTRGRHSGGFDSVKGFAVHHGATPLSASLADSVRYCTKVAQFAPIGNGTFTRDADGPKVVLWAGLASNTLGKGGPRWSTRGVIPLDSGNANTVNFEAENNGVNEPWSDETCDMMVRTYCACIEWANAETPGPALGPGDIFAHFEWAPGRKIDPAGPSRFNGHQARVSWDMDMFRGEVLALLIAGPGGVQSAPGVDPRPGEAFADGIPVAPMGPGDSGPAVGNLVDVLRFWGWLPQEWWGSVWTPEVSAGMSTMQAALGLPATGGYDAATMRGYSDFSFAMRDLSCALPAPLAEGSSGSEVYALQWWLGQRGWYLLRLDSSYGPRTAQAVQAAQRDLIARGFYTGGVTGAWDEATRRGACRAYEG